MRQLELARSGVLSSHMKAVAEREGLISLTLSMNGDPVDPEILDNFAYEIHAQFARERSGKSIPPPVTTPKRPSWVPQSKVNVREFGQAGKSE